MKIYIINKIFEKINEKQNYSKKQSNMKPISLMKICINHDESTFKK